MAVLLLSPQPLLHITNQAVLVLLIPSQAMRNEPLSFLPLALHSPSRL
jgi:hypothetical protein